MAKPGPKPKIAPIAPQDEPTNVSKSDLVTAFATSIPTLNKKLQGIAPIGKRGNAPIFRLADVCELKDVRISTAPESDDGENYDDPSKMPPDKRRLYYQAEDLRQAAELKARKNAIESGRLLDAASVERVVAEAFKTMALTLDTLPDQFERDGIIDSHNINRVIEIVDSSRNQLATDLAKVSPQTAEAEDKGDW